jgi:hypothetical protein
VGIREQVVNYFNDKEKSRVDEWTHDEAFSDPIREAANRATRQSGDLRFPVKLVPPHETDLAIDVAWATSGVVVAHSGDRNFQLFAHVLNYEHGAPVPADGLTVEVHPIRTCRRCNRLTPLQPAAASVIELGATLRFGHPVSGHHCL